MSIFLYSQSTKGAGQRLHTIIKTFAPKKEIKTFRTIDSLSKRLLQPKNDHDIVILLAKSEKELQEFVHIGDLLESLRVILVLPNRDDGTIAKGHTLRPRFITYTDSNFIDVAGVLSKMLSTTH